MPFFFDPLNSELQTLLALAVVALTAGAFLLRAWLRRKKPPGCSGGCGCATAKPRLPKP